MSLMEKVRHELREIGLVTAYFLASFLLLLSLKKLILLQYEIKLTILGTAVVSALVVAKVVIILDKTSFGSGFRSHPRVVGVLWRTFLYTAVVFAVTLLERFIEFYRESGDFGEALGGLLAGRRTGEFLAMNVGVGLSLLVYNTYGEIDRHLGSGALRALFFGRRSGEAAVTATAGAPDE